MTCKLVDTLEKVFVNDKGLSKIEARYDEEIVRNCPTCGGICELESTDDKGYRMLSPCPGRYALRRIQLYNNARLPARFMNATFESFNCERLSERAGVERFVREVKRYSRGASGFLLEGGPGTGKTHLLCAAIRYLTLEMGVPCIYTDFSDLLGDIRAAYSVNLSESDIIEPLVSAPVLFLDELGKGRDKRNDFEDRIINEIINRRYKDPALTTFFASNYRDRDSSGYNNYKAAGYGTSAWDKYADTRWRKERFGSREAFDRYVESVMTQEYIENRISESTVSRIMEMTNRLYINAPDCRRSAGKL